jgi:hypothetical protein
MLMALLQNANAIHWSQFEGLMNPLSLFIQNLMKLHCEQGTHFVVVWEMATMKNQTIDNGNN